MPPAARVGDKMLQQAPHCHAAHGPQGPVPHPAMPLDIIPPGAATVKIGGAAAARATDQSKPCMLAGCAPGGPGMIAQGSGTVKISNMPAARVGDTTAHSACAAPIPSPTGVILPPCCPTVIIGG